MEPWGPLARYAEPVPAGVASAYIEAYTEPGEIVLIPFCESETLVREVVKAGRKVIAVNFNPLAILTLRCQLDWPDQSRLDAAMIKLGNVPKHGMPLREYINGLYVTICPRCRHPLAADYFVWEGGKPVEKGYHCRSCGSEGITTIQPADLEALENIEKRGFHYWYILDRLAPLGDENRERAQRLLELYTPRNLHALAMLLIEIEDLFADSPLQKPLKLLLLRCLDSCSVLNPLPPAGAEQPAARPKRLRPPRRFMERNVWQAFEEAREEMRARSPLPAVRLAEDLGGILAPDLLTWVEGEPKAWVKALSMRRLARELRAGSVSLIFTIPPRPDPTFWALSFLWSGWLFGSEAAAPLKPLLKQRRVDWDWYREAMGSGFKALRPTLKDEGHLVLAFSAEEPSQMEALLLAAEGAGFKLESLLHRADDDQYRLSFVKAAEERASAPPNKEILVKEIRTQALAAAEDALRRRGEPLTLPRLNSAIYQRLSQSGLLRLALTVEEELPPLEFIAQEVKATLEEGLARSEGLWWLKEPSGVFPSLADRVERAVYEALREGKPVSRDALQEELCVLFPGLLTPEEGVIDACLASYGLEVSPNHWVLREEDQKEERERQRDETIAQLLKLGARLGYEAQPGGGDFHVLWSEEGETTYAFVVLWMATLSFILGHRGEKFSHYLVIPEERSSLVRFKLKRNPLLKAVMERGDWQFVKRRHLVRLLRMERVDRRDLKMIIGLKPIVEEPEAQMPLL